jgi:hypothetical protein
MNKDLMRHRQTPSFAAQGAARNLGPSARAGGGPGGGSKIVEGRYEAFYPRDTPIWLRISPASSYTYEVYDRVEKEVVEVTTTWLEYRKHYIPGNKNRTGQNGKRLQQDFFCSCGPRREQPCWGCAIRTAHYEKLDAIEARTGIRPDDEPPVSASTQFALAITVAEWIYNIPVRDSNGSIRKTRGGELIYRHIPAPFAEENSEVSELEGFDRTFGHRMHWSMGSQHLGQLLAVDERLRSHCGNCAGEMVADTMVCPSCETSHKLPGAVKGIDLDKARQKKRKCSACGETNTFVPLYQCPDCGDPKEGSLLSFDLRVMKENIGDNKSIIHVVDIRMPGSPDPNIQTRLDEMNNNPLKLDAIFAPTDLKYQKSALGDRLTKGLSPVLERKDESETTESYSEDDEDSEDKIAF